MEMGVEGIHFCVCIEPGVSGSRSEAVGAMEI